MVRRSDWVRFRAHEKNRSIVRRHEIKKPDRFGPAFVSGLLDLFNVFGTLKY
jgi:hypothetical protein